MIKVYIKIYLNKKSSMKIHTFVLLLAIMCYSFARDSQTKPTLSEVTNLTTPELKLTETTGPVFLNY